MEPCPYCGNDRLVKNGSVRGVPKWKCKACGRQTSLKPARADNEKEKACAVLLYLCGLSMNAIGFLNSVATSTILMWIRRFAQQRGTKPCPGEGGVVVMEIDELWHFVGTKPQKLWIWLAYCRDTGQIVDWECGDRDQETLNKLLKRLADWKVTLYCTDNYVCYEQSLPVGKHYQGKDETHRLERINSQFRHWIARFRRRTLVVSKSVEMVNLTIALFARFRINGSMKELLALTA